LVTDGCLAEKPGYQARDYEVCGGTALVFLGEGGCDVGVGAF